MGSKKATKRPQLKIADVRKASAFVWDEQRSNVAIALAEGKTQQEVAAEFEIADRTIRRWLQDTEFSTEVDRLSLMVGIAARAERLRIAQRIVRSKAKDGVPYSDKDLLEWLKYAQAETDGVKLDLAAFAAAFGGQEKEEEGLRKTG